MTALLNRLVREESGQDLIEYGLLIGIITLAVVAAIGTLGARVLKFFDDVNEAIK